MSPLSGIRVLDLSRLLPGPACSWYLAGLGASVDRVEPLKGGDPSRSIPPFIDGVGAFFASMNAGDRSLALDLRSPEALGVLKRLLVNYDVLIEGFKPGVLEAIGLTPAVLSAEFPELVVARISGYGQTGPWAHRPGHDVNYQGLAGTIVHGGLTDDAPHTPGVQVADLGGALVAAMGIAASLFDRTRTGSGGILDISLAESALSMIAPHVAITTSQDRAVRPGQEMLTGGLPVYGTYRCRDGRWLTVGALEPAFQRELAQHVNGLDRAALRSTFLTKSRDEWTELLGAACVAPALDPGELHLHPHMISRGAVQRLGQTTFVRPPLSEPDHQVRPAPQLGQHSDQILVEAGLRVTEIEGLRAMGVIS